MIVELPDDQIEAVLGAMRAIALAHGPGEASDEDRATIIAAGRIMLGREAVEPEAIEPVGPDQLAGAMLSGDDARMACRMIAVMSLVDGRLDDGKIELVQEFAAVLEVDEEYVQVLAEAAEDEISAAAACMIRKNAESFPELDTSKLDESAVAPFLPYGDGNDDRDLEARYLELEGSAPGSFGRAFYDHFQRNEFRESSHAVSPLTPSARSSEILREQRRRSLQVDVAARDRHPDARARWRRHHAVEEGRESESSGRLDHQLEALPEDVHGFDDGVLRDGHHVVDQPEDDRHRELAERRRARPVGDRRRVVHRVQGAGPERARGVIGEGWLDADDAAVWRQLTC